MNLTLQHMHMKKSVNKRYNLSHCYRKWTISHCPHLPCLPLPAFRTHLHNLPHVLLLSLPPHLNPGVTDFLEW